VEQKPSVGRIVHYVEDSTCRPAMIVEIEPKDAGGYKAGDTHLNVFTTRRGVETAYAVKQGEPGRANTWHWPERV
jgi:hypothetical protein